MNVFQRKFVSEVRRCDELERKLRYIQAEVHKDHVHVPIPESSVFPFAPNPREIINLEVNLVVKFWCLSVNFNLFYFILVTIRTHRERNFRAKP